MCCDLSAGAAAVLLEPAVAELALIWPHLKQHRAPGRALQPADCLPGSRLLPEPPAELAAAVASPRPSYTTAASSALASSSTSRLPDCGTRRAASRSTQITRQGLHCWLRPSRHDTTVWLPKEGNAFCRQESEQANAVVAAARSAAWQGERGNADVCTRLLAMLIVCPAPRFTADAPDSRVGRAGSAAGGA